MAALAPLPHGAEYALACSNRAQLHMLAQETERAIALGTRAAALAEALGATDILSHALNNVGTARWQAGDPAGRLELERSLRLALGGGHEEHAARAYTNLSSIAVERMEYAAAEETLAAGIAYCVERDLESWTGYMRAWLARLCFERGEWDRAATEAEALLVRPDTPVVVRQPALVVLARVRVRRGDPGAAALLDEALDLARATGELQRLAPVAAARAEAAWLAGEPERAAAEVRDAFELARACGDAWSRGELARWLARAGALGDERPVVAPPYAHELKGHMGRAAKAWQALGRPYEQAEALCEGGSDDAGAAFALFLALGARPAAERARARLRALGVRRIPRGPRPATRAHPAGLTARQMEVLALVARGLSNAEIGRRLCVSARTVEHHVAAILTRLSLASRREAAEHARAAGWLGQDGDGAAPR